MAASIISIVGMVLPTLLKLLGMWIDNAVANNTLSAQAAANYKAFLNSIDDDATSSAKLRKSVQDQLAQIDSEK